jgi:hypothetical protein
MPPVIQYIAKMPAFDFQSSHMLREETFVHYKARDFAVRLRARQWMVAHLVSLISILQGEYFVAQIHNNSRSWLINCLRRRWEQYSIDGRVDAYVPVQERMGSVPAADHDVSGHLVRNSD